MRELEFATAPRHLLPAHPDFPAGLKALREPPKQLFVAGSLPPLTRAVAIVGTRFADPDALEFANVLARDLATAGCPIISGGAAGVDSAAHRGALAAGGLTISVLASGLARAYPPENKDLFEEIALRGGVLSEFAPRPGPPQGWTFLRRNRLIAGLAACVVVVQAPARSGALSTAREAKQLKRRVFSVPAAPWDPRGTGCLQLLADGAEICTSAADILSLAPFKLEISAALRDEPSREANDYAQLPPSARRLCQWLRGRACYPDEIAVALDMPAAEVQEALLHLMLAGRCRRRANGCYEVPGARVKRAP